MLVLRDIRKKLQEYLRKLRRTWSLERLTKTVSCIDLDKDLVT
jgi:hypothetical protein